MSAGFARAQGEMARVRVKVSGVASVEDARACVEAGVDAIGVSLASTRPGQVDARTAGEIVRAVGRATLVVAEIADLGVDAAKRLRDDMGFGCLELAGDEPPEQLAPLLPHAYKSIRITSAADLAGATSFPGEYLLVRAPEGAAFDWTQLAPLSRARRLTLAGGLTPEDVAAAIRAVRPYAVEVTCAPGPLGVDAVERFTQAVHRVV